MRRPPDYIKKDAADVEFGDGIRAGSNAAGVLYLFDGDMLALQWRFDVDLGRFATAKKIVLKFADESMGDPFL